MDDKQIQDGLNLAEKFAGSNGNAGFFAELVLVLMAENDTRKRQISILEAENASLKAYTGNPDGDRRIQSYEKYLDLFTAWAIATVKGLPKATSHGARKRFIYIADEMMRYCREMGIKPNTSHTRDYTGNIGGNECGKEKN